MQFRPSSPRQGSQSPRRSRASWGGGERKPPHSELYYCSSTDHLIRGLIFIFAKVSEAVIMQIFVFFFFPRFKLSLLDHPVKLRNLSTYAPQTLAWSPDHHVKIGFGVKVPGGSDSRTCLQMQEIWIKSLDQEDSWRRAWQPTPAFLPGESSGQRNLMGYSPWGRKRVGHDWAADTRFFPKL